MKNPGWNCSGPQGRARRNNGARIPFLRPRHWWRNSLRFRCICISWLWQEGRAQDCVVTRETRKGREDFTRLDAWGLREH